MRTGVNHSITTFRSTLRSILLNVYGVRTERYNYSFYNNIDKWELFDLQEDPMEMNNLYGKTGYENITHQLEKELIRLQKQYQDTNAMSFNKQLIHE